MDTVSILTTNSDSTLYNRGSNINSLTLPLGYRASQDTLLFVFSNAKGQKAIDTLYVAHDNHIHFENIDCPPAVFHDLRAIRWSSHDHKLMPIAIDSAIVVSSIVNYDKRENIRIYLRTD